VDDKHIILILSIRKDETMRTIFYRIVLLLVVFTLASCANLSSMFQSKAAPTKPEDQLNQPLAETDAKGGPLGGRLAAGMDEIDLSKVARALDKAPGTETKWTNAVSGVTYAIKPVQKITVSGYQFCRSYAFTREKGGDVQQMNSRACIGNDGAWQDVG
jgi:surface antigen